MRSFIDYREAGRVILTHSYLLLGCALPLWLVPASITPSPLVMNAGVVALGVGDAMGALVGSSIGKRKIFGSKTVEGLRCISFDDSCVDIAAELPHAFFRSGEYTQVPASTTRGRSLCTNNCVVCAIGIGAFADCRSFFDDRVRGRNGTDRQLSTASLLLRGMQSGWLPSRMSRASCKKTSYVELLIESLLEFARF
ncbi:Polyprenol kinase family [Phytophthora cactorum]|nr:Polyprenol kinase family [Phytophthora cactorum]